MKWLVLLCIEITNVPLILAFRTYDPKPPLRHRFGRDVVRHDATLTSLVSLQQDTLSAENIKVLSTDPLVYLVTDMLSTEDCETYRQYVDDLSETRPMTRSNPPEVSLDPSKLWPLPLLAVGAGLPPVLRLLQVNEHPSLQQMFDASLPNIALALTVSLCLAFEVVLPLVRKVADSSSRTSVAMALNQPEDCAFVKPLVDKLASATHHAWDRWEAPVVTRYDPGAVFSRHGDASPTRGSEWKQMGGQRVVTCICYLNAVEGGGGETYFDKLDVGVSPVPGQALIFFPADNDSWQADDRTTHESIAPASEKWIVQLFGRAERVPPPLGLPDDYATLSQHQVIT